MQFNSFDDVRKRQSSASDAREGETSTQEDPGLLAETSKNLLKHIPGEASGFYLISAGAFADPGPVTLGGLAALSLAILILVRVMAKASRGVMITSILAFLLWMLVIDNGFLAAAFPGVPPDPWGLILASFYSVVVTTLAGAGKIK